MLSSSKLSLTSSAHSWSQVSRASKASCRLSVDNNKIGGGFVFIEGLSNVGPLQIHQDADDFDVKSFSSFGSSTLRDAVSLLSRLEIIEPISTDHEPISTEHPLEKLRGKLSSQLNALTRTRPGTNMDKRLDKVRLLESLLDFTQRAIAYAKTSTAKEVNAEMEGFFKEMERFISEAEMTSAASKRIKSKMTKEVLEIKRALSMGNLCE